MIKFILNNENIATELPAGTTVLDFARYHKNLKGTKIGCREGDCGACTILVGELNDETVRYRTMTSCLMPLANAAGKHIVTIEGVNPADGSLTPVQQAMVDESGTQCGFCTVGFVMSLTGFCIDDSEKTQEMAVSAMDGNICRCTGYKSIERASYRICGLLTKSLPPNDTTPESPTSVGNFTPPKSGGKQVSATLGGRGGSLDLQTEAAAVVPTYFSNIAVQLREFRLMEQPPHGAAQNIVAGGTDVYVQRPDEIIETDATHVFYDDSLRGVSDDGMFIDIGGSATVTDLLESPVMRSIFPDLYKHLKLISSTPIRNMATLAGNFINASPIGDMTVWFLALDAEIVFNNGRGMPLRNLYIDYKRLAKTDNEFIKTIRFKKPGDDFRFNFEKVCKRTYLDIASVNTAISLTLESTPGPGWLPPVLSEPGAAASGAVVDYNIIEAHVSAGGVSPIPLYLKETSEFLRGQPINTQTIADANEIMQAEISPISDVRGSVDYKRLLLRQLFRAHFHEIFGEAAV